MNGQRGTTERLDHGVRRSVLHSGTVVLTERMESVRSVAVGVWVRHGTAHEAPTHRGIAHLLEHMVFKGTRRRTALELASAIERTGGSLDAYTTHEHTSFQARVPADHLDTALDVLADLVFAPVLRASDLELERDVVLEEIARVEDTPDDLVFELHSDFMYAGHPYGSPILGTRESVSGIEVADLVDLHATAYRPESLVVAVAGQVEHEELVERISDLWPPASQPTPTAPVPPVGPLAAGRRRIQREGGRQSHIVVGSRGLPHGDPLRHASIVVSQAFGGGMSSRLFQRIREERGLAYAVFSFQASYARGGHVGAYVGARPDNAEAALEALLGELAILSREGLGAVELEEAREQIKGQILLSLESPSARMHRLAATCLYDEPYRPLDALAELIDGIGPEEAERASALYDPEGVAILELYPA